MSDLYWLTDEQMVRLEACFPKNCGKSRLDDRRVLNGIIFINRNGLPWHDAPKEYDLHRTRCNLLGARGVFALMMDGPRGWK